MKNFLALVLICCLVGCASTKPVNPHTTSENEAIHYSVGSTNQIIPNYQGLTSEEFLKRVATDETFNSEGNEFIDPNGKLCRTIRTGEIGGLTWEEVQK